MRHEVEYLLDDVLQPVVDAQPAGHPLRRVDRDNSTVYEADEDLDMQTPLSKRKADLQKANYVGVATQSETPTPAGPGQRYEIQRVVSIRLEGLSTDEYGHVDRDGADLYGADLYGSGVYDSPPTFGTLYRAVFEAIRAGMSYPDVGHPGVAYRDLTITNVDEQLADFKDFYRAEFDVQFRGYTDRP